MVAPGAWSRELLASRLVQPDQRSCGAAVLVVAEALRNERYARRLVAGGTPRFDAEVLAMHRRVTGPADVAGHAQLPWPRSLGTPPWSVARQLGARTGTEYVVRPLLPWQREEGVAAVRAAVLAGHPVPLYVGSRRLPRHVVLVLPGSTAGGGLTAYDPAVGRPRPLRPPEVLAGSISTLRWPVPWFALLPRP